MMFIIFYKKKGVAIWHTCSFAWYAIYVVDDLSNSSGLFRKTTEECKTFKRPFKVIFWGISIPVRGIKINIVTYEIWGHPTYNEKANLTSCAFLPSTILLKLSTINKNNCQIIKISKHLSKQFELELHKKIIYNVLLPKPYA